MAELSPLETIIRARIQERGKISLMDYMDFALGHHTHGYYMARDPFGEHGDFTTAPEISQIFGELIGAWLATMWHQMGEKEMQLIEFGPGRGTLMADALRATRHVQGFHDSIIITMIESSPNLRNFQQATLSNHHPRISWQPNLDDIPDMPTLFVANEFFDALPIRQFVKTAEGLRERFVHINPETNTLEFITDTMGIALVKGGSHQPVGDDVIVESCPAARQICAQIAAHIYQYSGAGLIIDYGYEGKSRGNTLQAVKHHGFWNPLEQPGMADITAHVAFDDLAEIFTDADIACAPITTQGEFLERLGGEMRLEALLIEATEAQSDALISGYHRLVEPQQMGELFKVLGVCSDDSLGMPGFGGSHER
jgi:NADH dehydrogenase [ubiquinone] 1 alpha subcomplex assembly factor 7